MSEPERSILTIVGARPQFVKAAVVSRAIGATPGLREILVHTGQHFDANMSDVFFEELGIPRPRHNLDIHGGGHGAMTGRMLERIEAILIAEKPDGVLVYGDTNSTLAGALAASKLAIPVFHVEAGLRSFLKTQPEEINRVLTDHLSALLFCPSAASVAHLKREGIVEGVVDAGDVMAEIAALTAAKVRKNRAFSDNLGLVDKGYVLATVHRQESTDDPAMLRAIFAFIRAEASRIAAGQSIVLPIHPRTRQACARLEVPLDGLTIIDPVGYEDMTRLIMGASLVLTDSGGLQKEAYWHRVPCITLRETTEWQETIESGWNRLWTAPDFRTPRRPIAAFDRIDASARIALAIRDYLNLQS